jgi:hypothetical protein
MIKEHERAALTVDLPEYGLLTGDIGTVVHIYPGKAAYELEMIAADGTTLNVVTVERDAVRPLNRADILHARSIA